MQIILAETPFIVFALKSSKTHAENTGSTGFQAAAMAMNNSPVERRDEEFVRVHLFAAASFILSFAASCASLPVQSPAADSRIVLAAESSSCQTSTTYAQWYALFGAVPLNKLQLPLTPGRTYRIREVHTPVDYGLTVIGGLFLTMTRKSILLETCAEPIAAYSEADLERKRAQEVQQILDALLKQSGERKGLCAILMKDGSVKKGKIVEISDDAITLLAQAEPVPPEKSEPQRPRRDASGSTVRMAKVLLATGRTITGEVISQTPRTITLRTGAGTAVLEKSQIRRVSYINEDAPEAGREERISFKRTDIVRILLPVEMP